MEQDGEYVRAAEYYISVLERDADWTEARDGLGRVGVIAIDMLLQEANDQEGLGEFDNAIATLDKLDDLRLDAQGVGVTLVVPDDYDAYREDLRIAAIDELVRTAERAEESGDWDEAIKNYERVVDKYELQGQEREDMLAAQAQVYLNWADDDMQRGAFRSGYERVNNTIDLLGANHPLSEEAYDLQERALQEGTLHVAFLPVWQTEDVSDNAPRGMITALNDVLNYDYWAAPPPFLATADPVQIRREMRRLRYDERPVTRSEASEIGRVLDADLIVIPQVLTLRFDETRVRDRTRGVKTRDDVPVDTSFIEKSYTGVLEAEIEYRIIDPYERKEVEDGSVKMDVSERMQRGIYDGDWRDLDLSRRQRQLFDEEVVELAERELEDELLDRIAPRLAEEIYEDLLKRVR